MEKTKLLVGMCGNIRSNKMIINQVVKGSGGGSGPDRYLEFSVDANGVLTRSTTSPLMNFSGVKEIFGDYVFYKAYQNSTFSGIVDMSDVEEVSGASVCAYMFYSNQNITSLKLSKLKTIDGAFTLDNICHGCTSLANIDFAALESFTSTSTSAYGFQSAFASTQLQTLRFPSLNMMPGGRVFTSAFDYCRSLQSLWFYALNTNSFGTRTNQFNNMLSGCTDVTVHFPIRIQSTIGSWTDVTNGFGGTNTTVLFDIVTTLTGADGNTYTRQEKDSTTTATAWVYNDTLYYTSGVSDNANGVNEPEVGDTIYSDSACTTAATTIATVA